MRLSREYVSYIAKQMVERLIAGEMFETKIAPEVAQRIEIVIIKELSVEDRINEKVREYLNQYSEQMQQSGASYQEMFKKIKSELVRREKVIL